MLVWMPDECQVTPVKGTVSRDFDGQGHWGVTHEGRFVDFQLFNSWGSYYLTRATVCHYPATQKQRGVKFAGL
jgi:hypothetical protein